MQEVKDKRELAGCVINFATVTYLLIKDNRIDKKNFFCFYALKERL